MIGRILVSAVALSAMTLAPIAAEARWNGNGGGSRGGTTTRTITHNNGGSRTVTRNWNGNGQWHGNGGGWRGNNGWRGGGWGGWGRWGWVGPAFIGAGLVVGAALIINGINYGTYYPTPQQVYIYAPPPPQYEGGPPMDGPPVLTPAPAYSSMLAYNDPKYGGRLCADKTVQRPNESGQPYLYTAHFCMAGNQWVETQSTP